MQHPATGNGRTSFSVIWTLSWPQMLTMVFHFFVGLVDVWTAGQIDRNVQASLGMITQSLFFFLILGQAVSMGTVSAVSQSEGAGLKKRSERYIGMSLLFAGIFSAVFLVIGNLFKETMLSLLQVPPEIWPVTSYFLGVYLLILPAYYVLITTNAIFRARKNVKVPLAAMAAITVVNTIGDLGLGLGWWGFPRLGYQGLAWATFGAIFAGASANLWMLRRKGLLRADIFPPLRWIKRGGAYLAKVAWPAGTHQILWQTGYLVIYAIVASLPLGSVDALAGMTAGLRVESALFLPAFGLNMTASILVGHHLGADDPAEAKRVARVIVAIGAGMMSLLAFVIWQYVDPIIAFLAPDEIVQQQTVRYLYWNLLAIPFTVSSMIFAGIMTGAGATLYNLVIFGVTTWGVRIPMAYVFGHHLWQSADGIWFAMLISQIIQSSVLFYFFERKNWFRFSMRAHRNNRRKRK